ncbi:MAG: glycerophosphodiester phosphodiesterase [Actinobacteria bacterium]|jgi:glycerophosphoryl diester phosphodiesterase|nr:MAG: glycerophosphodiester phosphodiesterase [Actinomycetota bacterium]
MLIKVCNDGGAESRELALISHRGGKGFGPENTLQSLRGALDFGVEMVETDVRMSDDGVPIIHHGPFLGIHLIGRMPMTEIREKAPDIPSLQEYLDLAGNRCAMNLEIKRCDAGVLAEVVAAASPSSPILVSSFDADFLELFRDTGSPAALGLLSQYERSCERILSEAARCGATTILPASFVVSEDLVDAAHETGIKVIAWTVNSITELRESVEAGVDGVITDAYPKLKTSLESGLTSSTGEIMAWPVYSGSTP